MPQVITLTNQHQKLSHGSPHTPVGRTSVFDGVERAGVDSRHHADKMARDKVVLS